MLWSIIISLTSVTITSGEARVADDLSASRRCGNDSVDGMNRVRNATINRYLRIVRIFIEAISIHVPKDEGQLDVRVARDSVDTIGLIKLSAGDVSINRIKVELRDQSCETGLIVSTNDTMGCTVWRRLYSPRPVPESRLARVWPEVCPVTWLCKGDQLIRMRSSVRYMNGRRTNYCVRRSSGH